MSKNPLFSRFHSFNILRIDRSKFDTDPTSTKRAMAVFMSTGQTIDMSFIYGQTTQLSETAIFVLGNNFLSFWRNEICAWLGVGSSMLTMYIAISFNFLLSSMCTIHSSIMLTKNLGSTNMATDTFGSAYTVSTATLLGVTVDRSFDSY